MRPLHRAALTICSLLALAACKPGSTSGEGPETVPPESGDAAQAPAAKSPIAIYESLEASIAAGDDSRKVRDHALEEIRGVADDGTAAYAFSRAAIAGRVAEKRGLQAGELVSEAESWAIKAREREPDFREGAATRLLGTLYVMAPPRLVEHGDSETGLELLEAEVEGGADLGVERVVLRAVGAAAEVLAELLDVAHEVVAAGQHRSTVAAGAAPGNGGVARGRRSRRARGGV
ncbi:MAG: hypothetical protein KC486_01745 [Myxococcales bacterium]|nr:hypothetical protein [Myxococcales bacterium]